MFVEHGMEPDKLDQQDYLRLMEILSAKPQEERPVPTEDAHANIAKMFGQ